MNRQDLNQPQFAQNLLSQNPNPATQTGKLPQENLTPSSQQSSEDLNPPFDPFDITVEFLTEEDSILGNNHAPLLL